MSDKRTPGHWKWFNDGDLANEDGYMVLRPDANRGVPTEADATLIAAAPELLEVIDRLLVVEAHYAAVQGTHPEFCGCNWCKAWGDAREISRRLKA